MIRIKEIYFMIASKVVHIDHELVLQSLFLKDVSPFTYL